MRAVACRVISAAVSVEGRTLGAIDRGLLVYVGVMAGDGEAEARWLGDKLPRLRLFPDESGRMNRSVADIAGGLLLVPNFTLAARSRKGNRPSFTDAAEPERAAALFDAVHRRCAGQVVTAAGRFGADMHIHARFQGPVTIILDSED